jgi:formylglycine-generating enzyme required for sulfatase activity
LPTDAQWEYACRAGTESIWFFDDLPDQLGDYGWYKENSGDKTHPVGEKLPNSWDCMMCMAMSQNGA